MGIAAIGTIPGLTQLVLMLPLVIMRVEQGTNVIIQMTMIFDAAKEKQFTPLKNCIIKSSNIDKSKETKK